MMQSLCLRTIIFMIIVCDIIRGNVITQSNNSTEDEYEFIMDTTITFYERPNKPKSKLYLTIPLIILLAIMYNLRLFLCHWIDWLNMTPVGIRIRAIFRNFFWRRLINIFSFHRNVPTSDEPHVSYDPREGATIHV